MIMLELIAWPFVEVHCDPIIVLVAGDGGHPVEDDEYNVDKHPRGVHH